MMTLWSLTLGRDETLSVFVIPRQEAIPDAVANTIGWSGVPTASIEELACIARLILEDSEAASSTTPGSTINLPLIIVIALNRNGDCAFVILTVPETVMD
jgi:hypothetical protein